MSLKCCDFLLFKEGSVGAVALDSLGECEEKVTAQFATEEAGKSLCSLNTMGLTPYLTANFLFKQQQEKYIPSKAVNVILSFGFKYQIFPSWRDKANCSRFGYNSNHVTLIQSDEINFGYISFISWMQIIGKFLPFEVVKAALENNSCFLPANDQIQAEVCKIFREASLDWGLGVIFIRESGDVNWSRINSPSDSQISDISDLEDSRLVQEIQIDKAFEEQNENFGDAHYHLGSGVYGISISSPEHTEVARNDLYISFTSIGSKGEPLYYACNDFAPLSIGWQMLTTLVTFGFAHPDNFLVNRGGNVWIVTDISPGKVNNAVKSRTDNKGISASLTGVFKNTMWYIVTSSDAGKALLFDTNLMECQTLGYFLTPQQGTMFISIEHSWETLGDYRVTAGLSLRQIKYPKAENPTSISKSWN
jgi:Bacterial protein of unknown function (DUF839)